MKYDLSGTPENLKFFDDVVKELGNIAMNTATSAVADGAATNRKLAEFLMQTRALVEDEAVQVIDAMKLAFDEKGEKLRALRAVTEQVSSEAAFMKTALNTVATKTKEIEQLTMAIDSLNASMTMFKGLVEDGTFDKAAKAAAALTHNAELCGERSESERAPG